MAPPLLPPPPPPPPPPLPQPGWQTATHRTSIPLPSQRPAQRPRQPWQQLPLNQASAAASSRAVRETPTPRCESYPVSSRSHLETPTPLGAVQPHPTPTAPNPPPMARQLPSVAPHIGPPSMAPPPPSMAPPPPPLAQPPMPVALPSIPRAPTAVPIAPSWAPAPAARAPAPAAPVPAARPPVSSRSRSHLEAPVPAARPPAPAARVVVSTEEVSIRDVNRRAHAAHVPLAAAASRGECLECTRFFGRSTEQGCRPDCTARQRQLERQADGHHPAIGTPDSFWSMNFHGVGHGAADSQMLAVDDSQVPVHDPLWSQDDF